LGYDSVSLPLTIVLHVTIIKLWLSLRMQPECLYVPDDYCSTVLFPNPLISVVCTYKTSSKTMHVTSYKTKDGMYKPQGKMICTRTLIDLVLELNNETRTVETMVTIVTRPQLAETILSYYQLGLHMLSMSARAFDIMYLLHSGSNRSRLTDSECSIVPTNRTLSPQLNSSLHVWIPRAFPPCVTVLKSQPNGMATFILWGTMKMAVNNAEVWL